MTRTLVPKIQTFKKSNGFTLIEILIVIGLIALITIAALPSIGVALKVNINSSARELASTIRSVYDESILTGKIHRIAIDMEKGEYWAESGTSKFLLKTQEQLKEEERQSRSFQGSSEDGESKTTFSLASSITKKKKKLPRGVRFTDAFTARTSEPVTTGVVYAHIFPHGFIEKFIVHFKDDFDREATLVVNSVTGKSSVYQRYVKDVQQ